MTQNRLADYLEHMRQAATDACSFVLGMSKDDFLRDKRTQQAAILNLIIIGEASTKVVDRYPAFAARHPDVPWNGMRGMRNRLAHGYFDINLDVVWDTIRIALPDLTAQMASLLADSDDEDTQT